MRLKSLELQGFKSFPDRTRLVFDADVSVVVGPNGSGKSNISDAIRWVLGEISSKNIRGSRMEDVIFGGTDTRKPMNFAEVSLTIDNSVGDARLDYEGDEITVTRRYMRTGDSEYMINRKPVRLRDISELFMNTGIGRSGYSIIGQGKVAEIISQKSEERRIIFEEAAGISKYRYKKHEAELKLNGVNDNLLRVGDIIAELESRVGPLEKEAERARRYLDLYEVKKSAEVSLWLYDVGEIRKKVEDAERTFDVAKRELDIADEALATLEAQNERMYISSQENKLKTEETRRKLSETVEARHKLESAAGILENECGHTEETLKATELELKLRRGDLASAEENSDNLRGSFENTGETLTAAVKEYESVENQLADTEDALLEVRLKKEAAERELQNAEDAISEGRLHLSELEGSRRVDAERITELVEEAEDLKSAIELLEGRIAKAKAKLDEYKAMQDAHREELRKLDLDASAMKEARERAAEELNDIRLAISASRQKADALRRMEEHFEGYAHSVRFIMEASERGQLGGIHGPVSRLISVEPRYSVAIETALGANIQNIVVEDEEAAKAAIALLKKQNAGRSTFYPLTSIKAQPLGYSDEELRKYKGYIGVASDIVDFEDRFASVISYILGRTAVCDTIDNAAYMAKAMGYRLRIVTLDGQIINAGGSFTGGSAKRDSGMLTRSAEIERIADTMQRDELRRKAAEEKLASMDAEIRKTGEKRADMEAKNELVAVMNQAEATQCGVLESQKENDERRLQAIEADLSRIKGQDQGISDECAAINAEIDAHSVRGEAIRADMAKLDGDKKSYLDAIDALQTRKNALAVRIAELRKDTEAAERALDFAEASRMTLAEKIESLERAVFASNEKLTSSRAELAHMKAEITALNVSEDELARLAEQLAGEDDGFEIKINEIRAKIKDKNSERERIFREYTRLESLKERLAGEQDKMTQTIWEEYELSYSAALALSYPPVTAENRTEVAARFDESKRKLRALGNVNTGAIEEYAEVKERYEFLSAQYNDLLTSREDLAGIITKLEGEMRVRFTTVLEDINLNFRNVFRELFGGGNAEIKLTDPEHALESGIEINVAPPGKIIKNLMLLSGGEQAFIAIALLFAILKVNPTPFCLFDEIEAALDEVNVARFAEYARRMAKDTQFIVITHRRGTMEAADVLYGVTMYEKGISRVFSLDVNEAEERLGVKL